MKYSNEPGKNHPEAQRIIDMWEAAEKEFKRMREEKRKELIKELCLLEFSQGAAEMSRYMKRLESLTVEKEIERLSQNIEKSMASIRNSRKEMKKLNKRLEELADYDREGVEDLKKTAKRDNEGYNELLSCKEGKKCGGSEYWKDGYTASKARSPRRRCKGCGYSWTVNPKKGGRNAVARRRAARANDAGSGPEVVAAGGSRPDNLPSTFLTAEKGKTAIISRSFLGGMDIKVVDDIIDEDIVKETMIMGGEFTVAVLKTGSHIAVKIGDSNSGNDPHEGDHI